MPQVFGETSYFTGIQKPFYAIKTANKSYTTPKQLSYAANIAVTPILAKAKNSGDNAIRAQASKHTGNDGTVELLNITLEDFAIIRGHSYQNGEMVKRQSDVVPDVAIGFEETREDGTSVFHWYYDCKFDEPSTGGDTEGENINFRNITMAFGSVADDDGDIEHELDTGDPAHNATKASNWFDAVQFFNPDTTAPAFVSSTPADAATGVAVGATVEIVFNKQMASGTFENILILEGGTTEVPYTYSVSTDGTTVTLTPDADMTAATSHTVVIANVKDTLGVKVAYTTFSFTTA